MSIFGFNEAAAIAAWGTFIYWQPKTSIYAPGLMWGTKTKREKKAEQLWKDADASTKNFWFFWLPLLTSTVLYPALTVFIFYLTQVSAPDSWQLIVGVVLFIVHMLADKMWAVAHYRLHRQGVALFYAMVQLLTAGGLYAAVLVDYHLRPLYYVPLIMLCLWSVAVVMRVIITGRMAMKSKWRFKLSKQWWDNEEVHSPATANSQVVYVRMKEPDVVPVDSLGRIVHRHGQ